MAIVPDGGVPKLELGSKIELKSPKAKSHGKCLRQHLDQNKTLSLRNYI